MCCARACVCTREYGLYVQYVVCVITCFSGFAISRVYRRACARALSLCMFCTFVFLFSLLFLFLSVFRVRVLFFLVFLLNMCFFCLRVFSVWMLFFLFVYVVAGSRMSLSCRDGRE